MSEEKVLKDNQVKLSDGRIVEMREQLGKDEMVVAGQLGDLFTMDGAGGLIFTNSLIVRTIVSIDGNPIPPIRKFAEVNDFMGQFKLRDWKKITALHQKLNADDETEGNDSESK